MHYAVIGAGFGDEGKGLMTDFLARKIRHETGKAPLNVRYNGGAQAGHTVVTNNDRHVFSHMGAGTFAGSSTYLSKDFIVNPLIMLEEGNRFQKSTPLIHPDARVSTIFDVVLNRIREESRGNGRHGSCGMGINETVVRNQLGYELRANDLLDPDVAGDKLTNIYENYFLPTLHSMRSAYDKSFNHYIDLATVANEMEILSRIDGYFGVAEMSCPDYERVVFEGAQGLELDEELGVFPHVTRSITGLVGALKAAEELNVADHHIEPVYVARCYKTRHGAGPLAGEGVDFINKKLVDRTNVTNAWQSKFRYAPLNLQSLFNYIIKDLDRTHGYRLRKSSFKPVIALTHLDEIDDKIMVVNLKGEYVWLTANELISEISKVFPVKYASYGERAEDVVEL